MKYFFSRSGYLILPPCPAGAGNTEAWSQSGQVQRRRLGELRRLSPLPLGCRAAAPAPLPGGGCEPVSARASPPPPGRSVPSLKGTAVPLRAPPWGLGMTYTVHRDSAPDRGDKPLLSGKMTQPEPTLPESNFAVYGGWLRLRPSSSLGR